MATETIETFELAVVGGGNMGAALAGGLIGAAGVDVGGLAVVEVVAERRATLADQLRGVTITDTMPPCRAALIAVKPPDVPAAVAAAAAAGATRLVSIAAGVRTATIEDAAGSDVAVVRAMPNTPALVGRGATALAAGASASAADVEWACTILGTVGTVEVVDEAMLDAFTGIAGSGPAYVFLVAEALIDAAVVEGFDAATAERIVTQLLVGSAALLEREGDPAQLRVMVTSPGGTTAAGLARLAEHDVRGAFGDAVRAATERSRELA